MISWLCGNKDAPEDKRDKVQEFLSVGDRVIAHKVKCSIKNGGKFKKVAKS